MKKLLSILSSILITASSSSAAVSCGSKTKTVEKKASFTLEDANVYQAEAGNYHRFMIAQPKFPDYKVGLLQLKAILKNEKTNEITNPRISSIDVSQDGWQIYVSFYDPIQLVDDILDLSFELISIDNETDGFKGINSTTNILKLANYSIDMDEDYPTIANDPISQGIILQVSLSPTGIVKYDSIKNEKGRYDLLPEWNTFKVWINGLEKKVTEAYVPYIGSTNIELKIDTNEAIINGNSIKVQYTWPDTNKNVSKEFVYDF